MAAKTLNCNCKYVFFTYIILQIAPAWASYYNITFKSQSQPSVFHKDKYKQVILLTFTVTDLLKGSLKFIS